MSDDRIKRALDYAMRYGGTDGDHHKAWVIDQMVRALTGCRIATASALDYPGQPYTYEHQVGSDEYEAWVAARKAGEDGPDTYEWSEGIPP